MYLYFDEVMGLVWSNDCESYASGSISTGRTTQVMIQTRTDTLILQVGGWGIRLTNSSQKKKKNSLFKGIIMDARRIILVKDRENVIRL